MADTVVHSTVTESQWDSNFFVEYVRENRFAMYMGDNENSVIQIKQQLTKQAGDGITIPLVRKLVGDGVTGSQVLRGSEEALKNFGHKIEVGFIRHATIVDKNEQQKTSIQLREASKVQLKSWMMEKTRTSIINALGSVNGTLYSAVAEATKDAALVANADRYLFGAAKANASSNDHSTSLANIDNTADKMTPEGVSLAKRMAKLASPAIRPIISSEDEEWFVLFAGSLSFRDLKNNPTMIAANRDGWTRGRDNPIFRDGDLIWDGVIIREVPEITVLTGVGAGAIDVQPNYLCGAQAVGWAIAQRSRLIVDDDIDYEFSAGVAVEENRGIELLQYNNINHGVLKYFTAGVADG